MVFYEVKRDYYEDRSDAMDGLVMEGKFVSFKSKESIFFISDLLIMGIRSESFMIFDFCGMEIDINRGHQLLGFFFF